MKPTSASTPGSRPWPGISVAPSIANSIGYGRSWRETGTWRSGSAPFSRPRKRRPPPNCCPRGTICWPGPGRRRASICAGWRPPGPCRTAPGSRMTACPGSCSRRRRGITRPCSGSCSPVACQGPRRLPAANLLRARPPSTLTVAMTQGHYRIGSREESFAYDNEFPPQAAELSSFRIAQLPVTNAEFLGFMAERTAMPARSSGMRKDRLG
jgi:hypothetical protein